MKYCLIVTLLAFCVNANYWYSIEYTWRHAEYSIDGGDNWISAKVGDTLYPGTIVQTGNQSTLILHNQNSTQIIMVENNHLLLPAKRLKPKMKESLEASYHPIKVLKGMTLFNVTKQTDGKEFSVGHPKGFAKVKGTKFSVTVNENVDIVVLEGHVIAEDGKSASQSLLAGETGNSIVLDSITENDIIQISSSIFMDDVRYAEFKNSYLTGYEAYLKRKEHTYRQHRERKKNAYEKFKHRSK